MAKNIYVGISSKARKMKAAYIGISGKARKIKKIYIGVGGKARLAYQSYVAVTSVNVSLGNPTLETYKSITSAKITIPVTVTYSPSNATVPPYAVGASTNKYITASASMTGSSAGTITFSVVGLIENSDAISSFNYSLIGIRSNDSAAQYTVYASTHEKKDTYRWTGSASVTQA